MNNAKIKGRNSHFDEMMVYARGFAQRNAQNKTLLLQSLEWSKLAQQEIERRAQDFIQMLPTELLVAVATEEVLIPDMARNV